MKFVYEYRTSDNVPHRGTIAASTKEAAYDTLKAQGIKPGKVWEAPGLANKVLGKGKRWIAIAVLLLVATVSTVTAFHRDRKTVVLQRDLQRDVEDRAIYEDRGQLYGDPTIIRDMAKDGWASVFPEVGDQLLADYAVPCSFPTICRDLNKVIVSLESDLGRRIAIGDDDLREVAQMKRMVNAMRRELQEYVEAGGSVRGYVRKLPQRQEAELAVYEKAKQDLSRGASDEEVRAQNNQLRAKGLPLVSADGEPEN